MMMMMMMMMEGEKDTWYGVEESHSLTHSQKQPVRDSRQRLVVPPGIARNLRSTYSIY